MALACRGTFQTWIQSMDAMINAAHRLWLCMLTSMLTSMHNQPAATTLCPALLHDGCPGAQLTYVGISVAQVPAHHHHRMPVLALLLIPSTPGSRILTVQPVTGVQQQNQGNNMHARWSSTKPCIGPQLSADGLRCLSKAALQLSQSRQEVVSRLLLPC